MLVYVLANSARTVAIFFTLLWRYDPIPGYCLPLLGFEITPRHTTHGRTPVDEWLARRTDIYLTTHNIQNRHTSTPPAEFESAIPASKQRQINALDRAATGIGKL